MVRVETFTADEWRTLQFGPYWVFSAVLGAYKDFDPLEYEAFSNVLAQACAAPGRLARQIVDSVLDEHAELTRIYQTDERTIGRGLCAVAAVLRKAPADEANLVKDMLIAHVGTGIARARGRFGRVISEDDQKTLELITQFLC